ncbi:MAG: hypothetical protein H6706_20905 [Myxococcales bacterium]|nr:hypothetical protein [Myxococcales bacterium]
MPNPLDNVDRVRFWVVDAAGLESAPLEVDMRAPDVVELGDVCDLLGARSICAEGVFCEPQDAGGARCAEPVAECGPGILTGVINDHPIAGGAFEAEGDTSDALIQPGGSCGGGAGQDVWSFTAPAGGLWRARTTLEGNNDDTVLYARSLCGVAASELACNDDDDGVGYNSAISFPLDAGQTVYLFVDGYTGFGAPPGRAPTPSPSSPTCPDAPGIRPHRTSALVRAAPSL